MASSYPKTLAVPSGGRVSGQVALPGSKSITQRYFNLALLTRRALIVHRPLWSDDTEHYLQALRTCGFGAEREAGRVRLFPEDGSDLLEAEIHCGHGGTMLRFLTATLAVIPGVWRLDGSSRLRERPLGPLIEALRSLGAQIECLGQEGHAPLGIRGGHLRGGQCRLDAGASSQYLSALLMAAQVVPESVSIEVEALTSKPYVDLTLDAIADFGGHVEIDGTTFGVPKRPSAAAPDVREVSVEADFSAAAYPAAAALLTGGEVILDGLRSNSRQGDRKFIDLLADMGARVSWSGEELRVAAGDLEAVTADLSKTPDQVPTLAAIAPFVRGTTRITGVPHLRIKESDRLYAMARELERAGAAVTELDDGLIVPGSWVDTAPPETEVGIKTYDDHRIAMSMALVGLRRPGVVIHEPGVVAKSYPEFWRHLDKLLSKT